jgi:DNA-binding NarL/FixJ family response regulator
MSEHEIKNNAKTQSKHLTDRELEVLKLVTLGKSNTEIAKDLGLSVHTIKAHVCSILHKFGVDDRVQAAVKAVKQKIIP